MIFFEIHRSRKDTTEDEEEKKQEGEPSIFETEPKTPNKADSQ